LSNTHLRGFDAEYLPFRLARSAVIVGDHLGAEGRLAAQVEEAENTGDVTVLSSAPGCYSVLLTHAGGLSAYTDPVGQFPLYSVRAKDRVLLGPSASALAAEVGAAVDLVSIAARIACPDTPDLLATRTMYRNVSRIPEGTVVHVDEHGMRQTAHGRIRSDPAVDLGDAAERLRDHLLTSMRARLDSTHRLTTDFSGGFDSTSLAFLAATGEKPIAALTSYQEGISGGSDDVERARRFARLGALTHHMVPGAPEHLPFQRLVAAGEEPHVTPIFIGPLLARLAAARELGADLHLVGEGGDVVLGAPPVYLADLVRAGDLATVWQHCVAWARLRTRSPLALFRRAVAVGMTSRRQALHGLARHIRHGHQTGASSWEGDWICHWRRPHADWLTARARRQLAAELHDVADDASVSDLVTRSWLRSQALTQQAVRDAGRELGIRVHAPFLDADVVRACLSLPASRRVDPTMPKPLLRKALSHLVPKVVLSHPAKGDYTREAYHGVRHAAPVLRRLVEDSAAADHGLIEPAPVRVALERAIHGLPTPWGALNQVLAVELWLREREGNDQ
jgi:asparagine synthase (glutamine-hydrolysing)